MADFLGTNKDEEEDASDSTFKIGDKEYSQDELSELVELGNFAKEVEQKQNTKLDKLYPEFTKKSQRLKEIEAEYEKVRRELEARQSQPAPQGEDFTPEQIAEARKAGRKIGFLTDDVIEETLGKSFRQLYLQERAAEKLIDKCDGLAKEIDGSDGRVAFNTEDVLTHMQETGIRDPEKAYKDKYEAQLDEWRVKQISQAKKPGMMTIEESTAGSKHPSPVKVTSDNLNEMVKEALAGK
jgi:hypothetical protein